MSGNKPDFRASSRPLLSDFAKVDAHVLTDADYEDIPEITDEMWARAVLVRGDADRDLPLSDAARLPLEPDVASGLRAMGDDWEQRGNAVLRDWLARQAA